MDPEFQALAEMFRAESEEGFAAMEQALLALEVRPEDEEVLASLFRAAHTLKGNAASMGFTGLSELAHALENLLDGVRARLVAVTPDLCTLLLESLDALRALLPAALGGADVLGDGDRALMERLSQAASSAPAQAASESEPAPRTGPTAYADGELAGPARGRRTLRVDVDRLDQILNVVGELGASRGRLRRALDAHPDPEAVEEHEQLERLSVELQELVMAMRLVPIGPVFRQLDRTVRDVALARGKSARLVVAAENVQADMSVIEPLRAALTHLVRNAVDHGIEAPERRRQAGKEAAGTVRLTARHEGGSLVVEVADDGAGLARRQLLEKARAAGVVREDERLSDDEIDHLVFHRGLSTAAAVTEISGRGVGMDVVRHNVDALRGSVRVDSGEGVGTTVTLRLPLSVAIVQGFAVRVGQETFVIPMDAVLECSDLAAVAGVTGQGGGVLDLRGDAVPYLRLRDHFGIAGASPTRESVVIVRDARLRAGLAVDALLGESQTVVKPLGGPLRRIAGVAGATVRADGGVALILDVSALLRQAVSRRAGAAA